MRHRFVRLFDELELTSHWQVPPAWPYRMSSRKLLALTRFIEEALTNAIKHSRADTFGVTLCCTPDNRLMLEVRDNGVGFDVAAVSASSGVGMQSMKARIARIRGRLEILSRPGETRLRVYLETESESAAHPEDTGNFPALTPEPKT